MGAKIYILIAACFLMSGCELGRRLAPPGFVKYEDLAQGQPVNPEIERQAQERRASGRVKFPLISSGPAKPPQTTPPDERTQARIDLLTARGALETAKAGDLDSWAKEQENEKDALENAAADLKKQAGSLKEQAAREKNQRP